MSGPRDQDELPGTRYASLEDVRRLEIAYSRVRPGEGACFVEYVGGRVEVLEVDRYLIEHLLEHLVHREA
jgi:hypothetical protein